MGNAESVMEMAYEPLTISKGEKKYITTPLNSQTARLFLNKKEVPLKIEKYSFSAFNEDVKNQLFITYTPDRFNKEYDSFTDVIIGIIYQSNEDGIQSILGVAFSNYEEMSDSSKWKFFLSDFMKNNNYIKEKIGCENPSICTLTLQQELRQSSFGIGYGSIDNKTIRHLGFIKGFALRSIQFQFKNVSKLPYRISHLEVEWSSSPDSKGKQVKEIAFIPKKVEKSKKGDVIEFVANEGCYLSRIGWIWSTSYEKQLKGNLDYLGIVGVYSVDGLNVERPVLEGRLDKNTETAENIAETAPRSSLNMLSYEKIWNVTKDPISGTIRMPKQLKTIPDSSFAYPVATSSNTCKLEAHYRDILTKQKQFKESAKRLLVGSAYNPPLAIDFDTPLSTSNRDKLMEEALNTPLYVTQLPDPDLIKDDLKLMNASMDNIIITSIYYYPKPDVGSFTEVAVILGIAISTLVHYNNPSKWRFICSEECQKKMNFPKSQLCKQVLPSPGIGYVKESSGLDVKEMNGCLFSLGCRLDNEIGYPATSFSFSLDNKSKNIYPDILSTYYLMFSPEKKSFINSMQLVWSVPPETYSFPSKYFGLGQIIGCSATTELSKQIMPKESTLKESLQVIIKPNTAVLLVTLGPKDPAFLMTYFPLIAKILYGWCVAYKSSGNTKKPKDAKKISNLWYPLIDVEKNPYLKRILDSYARYIFESWSSIPLSRSGLILSKPEYDGFSIKMKDKQLFKDFISLDDIKLMENAGKSGNYINTYINTIVVNKSIYDFDYSKLPEPLSSVLLYRFKQYKKTEKKEIKAIDVLNVDIQQLIAVSVPYENRPQSGEALQCILGESEGEEVSFGFSERINYIYSLMDSYSAFDKEKKENSKVDALILLPPWSSLYLSTYFPSAYNLIVGLFAGKVTKKKSKPLSEERKKLWKESILQVLKAKEVFLNEVLSSIENKIPEIEKLPWYNELSGKPQSYFNTYKPKDAVTYGYMMERRNKTKEIKILELKDTSKIAKCFENAFGIMLAYYSLVDSLDPSASFQVSSLIESSMNHVLLIYASSYATKVCEDKDFVNLLKSKENNIDKAIKEYQPKDPVLKLFYNEWKSKNFVNMIEGSNNVINQKLTLNSSKTPIPRIEIDASTIKWPVFVEVIGDDFESKVIDTLEYPIKANKKDVKAFRFHLKNASNSRFHPSVEQCHCSDHDCNQLNM